MINYYVRGVKENEIRARVSSCLVNLRFNCPEIWFILTCWMVV